MTLSEFYRDEAARCQRRAEKSRRPERAQRWKALADESLYYALLMEGGGREWSVIHSGSPEEFRRSVLARGGEVADSRDATLEEIFLARAGRDRQQAEAA